MRQLSLLLCGLLCAGCLGRAARPMEPGTITHEKEGQDIVTTALPGGAMLVLVSAPNRESTHVRQPQNPDGAARLSAGDMRAEIPAAATPAGPPTPAARALGGLVWLGAIMIVIGAAGVGMRWFAWGRVVPVGLSVAIGVVGGIIVLFATVLSATPWWVMALALGGAVTVALIVAARDNWQLLNKG